MATKENNLIKRYPPNSRFNYGAFKDQVTVPIVFDDFGKSVTDKESYRLSLASKRGSISTLGGSYQKGQYMFEDGQYNSLKDFSFALRKDLSIVEIDEYINSLRERLETSDTELSKQIQSEILKAEAAKTDLQKKQENNSESSE